MTFLIDRETLQIREAAPLPTRVDYSCGGTHKGTTGSGDKQKGPPHYQEPAQTGSSSLPALLGSSLGLLPSIPLPAEAEAKPCSLSLAHPGLPCRPHLCRLSQSHTVRAFSGSIIWKEFGGPSFLLCLAQFQVPCLQMWVWNLPGRAIPWGWVLPHRAMVPVSLSQPGPWS